MGEMTASDSLTRLNSLDVSQKPDIARGFGNSGILRFTHGTLSTRKVTIALKNATNQCANRWRAVSLMMGQYCLSVLQDPSQAFEKMYMVD